MANLLAQCLRFVPEWQNYPETGVCNSKTGACWRGPLSVELTAAGVIVWAFFRCSGGGTGLWPATLSYEGEAACALEALAAYATE